MELFSPEYYKKFKCIADKCTHSCCVGWEIAVDSETFEKYTAAHRSDILSHIAESDGCREILLGDDGRCPFLDGRGLCRIISELGDGAVSEICREHPRFYHRIGARVEVGLGIVCEEAARLVLSEDLSSMCSLGEHSGDVAEETDLDTLSHREEIFAHLASPIPYREKITALAEKYGVADRLSGDFSEAFSELEYLEEDDLALFEIGAEECRPEVQTIALRFLTYLIFRHVSVARDEENLRARVGFCLLLLAMLENAASALTAPDTSAVFDIARRLSAEIEYSEENTAALIFEFECSL